MPSRAVPFTGESVSRYLATLKKWKENRDWRIKETEAGRPSTFEDYCRAHGLCPACAASGITRNENGTGFKAIGWNGKVQLFEECCVCSGTGKITVPS